jgi:histidinol-phosphate phosphatase family protein
VSRSVDYAVVVPTVGRASVHRLLDSLTTQHACAQHPRPRQIVLVDDRPDPTPALVPGCSSVTVLRSYGRGPAAARNVGWRSTSAPWVVFLDDDVELGPEWSRRLADDLTAADHPAVTEPVGADPVGAVQGRIHVPLPADRRPTDWERGTAGLADARWITADIAYRRAALRTVGGFDERFPRAYREDADLALRVREAGWRLERGRRTAVHPVRPAGDWVSLRVQAGAADDALMRRLHGPSWRRQADTGRGRLPWHTLTVAAAAAGCALLAARRPRAAGWPLAGWLLLTADFARRRIAPGPSPATAAGRREVRRMLVTSVLIPPAAVWHRLRGTLRHRSAARWPVPVRAVLFDRDGTLVHDVPYNGNPALVAPTEGAAAAVRRLRAAGLRVAVVSNQSGIGRGLVTGIQVDAVNRRIDEVLGPFDTWQVCPHAPEDGCGCRKPEPGLILTASRRLRLAGFECAVVGDIGADVHAAIAAGARPVLVPTPVTRQAEIDDAPATVDSLTAAVELILREYRQPAEAGT